MQLISKILLLLAHVMIFAICVGEVTTYMSENYPLWAIAVMIFVLSLLVVTVIIHVKTFIKHIKNN